jgi:hypothetical protein
MIKDFQRAITDKDWAAIIHCWEILSGENYEPTEIIKPAVQKGARKKPNSRAAAATMNPVVTRRNKFEEMVPKLKIDKDAGYDKVRDDVEPTPRTRNPFKLKSVKCMQCGISSEVAPIFAREQWKCDNCALGKKRQGK